MGFHIECIGHSGEFCYHYPYVYELTKWWMPPKILIIGITNKKKT